MPSPPSVLDFQKPQVSIVILGSGLAGLTLGHCLPQKGIPSIVYERVSSSPRHTYGIALRPRAYEPLLRVLNIDELTFRKNVAVHTLNQNGIG